MRSRMIVIVIIVVIDHKREESSLPTLPYAVMSTRERERARERAGDDNQQSPWEPKEL